ncbi:MAG TPA: hypothetical protein VHP35_04250 [Terriglobia bacterium]|nr:hypothetical protein [Terriglobia bacterium]
MTAIGLLNEKSLHSALKHWYAKPGDLLEFALDGYVVDILRGNHVIEIQTGSFSSIKRKMRDLSCRYRVTLIYPVAHERWILEVPGTLQGAIMRRKSPKRQAVNQLFEELVSFPDLLKCPNFSIEVVSIQEEQLRRYSRRCHGKRRTWRVVERRLLSVLERFPFDAPSDLWQLIPPTLPDPFETSHLALALGHPRWFAQKIAYCLRQSGVITAIGKKGNSLVYSRLAPSATGLDNEATGRTSAMAPMASHDARLITPTSASTRSSEGSTSFDVPLT